MCELKVERDLDKGNNSHDDMLQPGQTSLKWDRWQVFQRFVVCLIAPSV